MVRKRVWVPILAVVVIALLAGGNLITRGPKARTVKAEAVALHDLQTWVRAPGWIRPVVAVEISSNVTGRVERLHVREGDAVSKGDLLLTLDGTRFRSMVDQHEAMLRAAQTQLTLAEAQRDLADQVLRRREELFGRGLLSSEELETAGVDARVKHAQVAAQGEEIDRLRAALTEAQRDLEETHFYAPVDGVVTALNLEEGENVVIGTMNAPGTVILTLSDLSQMEVEARVSESDVVLVDQGQHVRVEVDAVADSALDGSITAVGESGNRLSRDEGAEFEVRVRIAAPPAWLKPGMSADVEILVAEADSVAAIPIQALVARDEETILRWEADEEDSVGSGNATANVDGETASDRKAEDGGEDPDDDDESSLSGQSGSRRQKLIEGVFVIQEERTRFRRVKTGIRSETHIQVDCGLELGERIVTGPYRELRRLEHDQRVTAETTDPEME